MHYKLIHQMKFKLTIFHYQDINKQIRKKKKNCLTRRLQFDYFKSPIKNIVHYYINSLKKTNIYREKPLEN